MEDGGGEGLGSSKPRHSASQKDWHARTQLSLGKPPLLSPVEPVTVALAPTLSLPAWGTDASSSCADVKENALRGLRDTGNNRQLVVLGKQHWRCRGWEKEDRWLVKARQSLALACGWLVAVSCGWICVILWLLKSGVFLNSLPFQTRRKLWRRVGLLQECGRSIAKMAAFFVFMAFAM